MLDNTIKKIFPDLSLEIIDKLEVYVDEMLRWNARINLTAIRDYEEIVEKHIIDSLFILPWVPQKGRLIDLGSGAGLPAVPIALCRPQLDVVSIDSVGKKINFQKNIKRKLKIENLTPLAARIESLEDGYSTEFDTVVARAFASLADIIRLAKPLMTKTGSIVAMKGPEGERELGECRDEIVRSGLEIARVEKYNLPISQAERFLIELSVKTDD